MPEFFVIIPTYNRDGSLGRAINSVLAQDYDKWQIVIVDDGSTDNTKEAVEPYLHKYPERITYLYKKNGGVGSARNLGIKWVLANRKIAQDDFFIFLDSDDEMLEDSFTKMSTIIAREKDPGLFFFGTIDSQGNRIFTIKKDGLKIGRKELVDPGYKNGDMMVGVRASILKGGEYWFDEEINGGEILLFLNISKSHKIFLSWDPVKKVNFDCGNSLIRGRISRKSIQNMYLMNKKIIQVFGNDLKRDGKRFLGQTYLVLSRATVLLGKRKEALSYFCRGFLLTPFDFRRIFLFAISLVDFDLRINNYLHGQKDSGKELALKFNIKTHDRIARLYEKEHGDIYNEVEQSRLNKSLENSLKKVKTGNEIVNALDFGTGAGNLAEHLLELGCRVTAADVTPKFLELVANKYKDYGQMITTMHLNGRDLSELADNSFDFVASYSVLHHVPDYLGAVSEMCRILKPGGILYLDHELAPGYWRNNKAYNQFWYIAQKEIAKKTRRERIAHLFVPRFWQARFRFLLNPRYRMEGDIHVFPDDHIEWSKIKTLLQKGGFEVLVEQNYLLFRRHYPASLYEEYKKRCHDIRLVVARKKLD
ncbi:MAG: GalNAc(5)-diNAcBac-PP-undecaprenol beta-1,3-glucosyltransferase [bacterium ADurb.Bin400]|nr:MAG: GalNAc(5)-diNAcBac-PP-undecaprenol beta-1,3-glucosyltransferase [bacterium ADurb.Bin400]